MPYGQSSDSFPSAAAAGLCRRLGGAQRTIAAPAAIAAIAVIAGSDCGFGTFAGFGAVDEDIVYAKLAAMAAGAAMVR